MISFIKNFLMIISLQLKQQKHDFSYCKNVIFTEIEFFFVCEKFDCLFFNLILTSR